MSVDGVGSANSTLLNSIIENASLTNQLSVTVAAKAQDAAKQQGDAAVSLIKAAQLVDVRA